MFLACSICVICYIRFCDIFFKEVTVSSPSNVALNFVSLFVCQSGKCITQVDNEVLFGHQLISLVCNRFVFYCSSHEGNLDILLGFSTFYVQDMHNERYFLLGSFVSSCNLHTVYCYTISAGFVDVTDFKICIINFVGVCIACVFVFNDDFVST